MKARGIFQRSRSLDENAVLGRQRRHGLLAVVLILVIMAVTGLAFVNPMGQQSYTAHLTNSGGLRPGDDVRVAGISVGKVTSVRVSGTVVAAEFTAKQLVAVGTDSTIDVKLLTPLGGHYLSLDPQGVIPLGQNAIPPEHTSVPFEINEIFQKFTPIVKKVDGKVIHDTYAEVAAAARKYPDALRDVLQSGRTLIHSLSATTQDYHRGLDYVNEYSRAFANGEQQLTALVTQFALIGQTLTPNSVDAVEAFSLVAELTRLAKRALMAYDRDYRPIVDGIDDIFDTLFAYPERLGEAAKQLGQIINIVSPMLSGNGITVDQGSRVIPGQDVCLPHFFRQC